MKRRIAAALLALAFAFALLPAGLAEEDEIDAVMARMTLRDELAQMMMPCFRAWKDDPAAEKGEPVTRLNDALRACLARNCFGGCLLYAENISEAEQTLRLISDMQTAQRSGGGAPLMIATDQEGGTVARIGFGTSGVSCMSLSAAGDPALARDMARVYGEELALLGIHTGFSPVLDVNDNPSNPVIGVRSFGDDPETVSVYGGAFIEGLAESNVIAAVKHFPGHGNTDTDSHTGLPMVNRSYEELRANELIPFKAAIDAGADMVMTAHIQFPKIEDQQYVSTSTGEKVYIPATMSGRILTDILRGELGFDGVIVSDALEMSAIRDHFAMDDVLTMTINAGVNLLLTPRVGDPRQVAQLEGMLDRAVELVEAGAIDRARVDDSVRRILSLKKKYGILDPADFAVTEEWLRAVEADVGSEAHRETAWSAAFRAATLLKNENGAFPLDVRAGERTLILFSAASRAGAVDIAKERLCASGALPEGAEIISMVIEPDTAEACMAAAAEADHVIAVSRAWDISCLDPSTENGYPVGIIRKVISQCHERNVPVIVISAQLPYDAACYPEADALLLTFSSGATTKAPPASGAGSAFVPSLPAAICEAFGMGEPAGRLPVDLPQLDGAGRPTEQILYPAARGK